jgi:DNA-binding transcriptional ArsR family regulator
VAELVPSVPAHLPLRSESDDDRRVVEQRLARLRRSSRLRDTYGRLLDDVWAALRPAWQRARPAVQAACADRRERLVRGEPWAEVVRGECDFGGLAQRLVNELGGDDELVIVPAFFTHKGLLLDLPRLVLVGVRVDAVDAAARVRSEALARRLKSLADPTRLAIVDQLAQRPRTVTELARSFGIAQPTVSNHVKLLRDAGLVHDVRVGPRRQLEVDRPALAQLLEHLGSVVTPAVSDRVSG